MGVRPPRGVLAAFAIATLFGVASGQTGQPLPLLPPVAVTPPAAQSSEIARLRSDLDALVRGATSGASRWGILVASLDRGDTLYSRNPDLALAPASNMKLYSTAAAFYYLGPGFRFSTYLLADGPLRDGALQGDLILYGTGDPSISNRMLESSLSTFRAFADSLAQQGIREIRGDLVGDGSYFDDRWIAPGWEPSDLTAWYGAPVGALSFAENLVSIRVLPGPVGGAAVVRTTPETRGLSVENRVRTVASGATRVRLEHAPGGIVATGQVRRGSGGFAGTIPVVDPANYAAAAFRGVLEERGIRVTGRTRTVHGPADSRVTFHTPPPAPEGADRPPPRVLAIHLSPLLTEIAAVTNHVSHNLFAEALFKTVGRVAAGEGSFAGGARAVQYLLECETRTDSAASRLVDGSGLSRLNRVTARTTIRLLDYMARDEAWYSFYESLPQAAAPSGLRRMQNTPAAGNLRAKTGTIKAVSALSGYVHAANGERLAFSIIGNGLPSTARGKRVEDAIGARLAAFDRE